MKSVRIYQYERCSTCKAALNFLNRRGIDYESISIVDEPPSELEIKKMISFLGGDLRKVFNTSGVLYREMGLSKKLASLSEKEAVRLLRQNGKLVKRPFLLSAHQGIVQGIVGFRESEWEKFFSKNM